MNRIPWPHPIPSLLFPLFLGSTDASAARRSGKNRNLFGHAGHSLRRALPAIIAMLPMAVAAGEQCILYHELDGNGGIIRSIAMGDGMSDLISATVTVIVYWKIIRLVMGDK